MKYLLAHMLRFVGNNQVIFKEFKDNFVSNRRAYLGRIDKNAKKKASLINKNKIV